MIATPIDHLDDITLRALEALRSADVIAPEDSVRKRLGVKRFGSEAVIPGGV